jgi:hypothetical protein
MLAPSFPAVPQMVGYESDESILGSPFYVMGHVPGLILRGDLGATHGDKSGNDTMLRTHWNNQTTGIVNDEVFELRMEPKNWGELEFRN